MYSAIPFRRSVGMIDRSPYLGVPGFAGLGQTQAIVSDAVGIANVAVNTWLNQINLAHDADTATTQIVNGLAPLLQANVNAYLAGPRTCADQAAAMSAYLTAVQWLMSAKGCGNGAYGSAGNRCISDRFGGGGATDPNAKWPWASYYYYPIANDPMAAACAAQTAANNPDAGLISADQNILNLVSGSTVQTTAGQVPSGSSTTTSTSILPTGSVTIGTLSIPTSYLLIGGAALLLIVVMTK